MPVDTDRARLRSLAKREIAAILGRLPLEDQSDVLADLTVAVEDSEPQEPKSSRHPTAPARAGRPKGSAANAKGTNTAKLLALIKPGNELSIGEVADKLYSKNDRLSRARIRSLLGALKKRRLVRRVGPGRWEAVPQK